MDTKKSKVFLAGVAVRWQKINTRKEIHLWVLSKGNGKQGAKLWAWKQQITS